MYTNTFLLRLLLLDFRFSFVFFCPPGTYAQGFIPCQRLWKVSPVKSSKQHSCPCRDDLQEMRKGVQPVSLLTHGAQFHIRHGVLWPFSDGTLQELPPAYPKEALVLGMGTFWQTGAGATLIPLAFSDFIQQLLVKFTSHHLEEKITAWDKKKRLIKNTFQRRGGLALI